MGTRPQPAGRLRRWRGARILRPNAWPDPMHGRGAFRAALHGRSAAHRHPHRNPCSSPTKFVAGPHVDHFYVTVNQMRPHWIVEANTTSRWPLANARHGRSSTARAGVPPSPNTRRRPSRDRTPLATSRRSISIFDAGRPRGDHAARSRADRAHAGAEREGRGRPPARASCSIGTSGASGRAPCQAARRLGDIIRPIT